jgi:hypothetical protein
VRHARAQVALLLEMAADDFALRSSSPGHLAGALFEMSASGAAPTCALAAGSTAVVTRIHRLLRPGRTSATVAVATVVCSVAVVAVPFAALV